ncbi:kinase-like domain-containing protein [Mycena crocata]|nr:kinase-like domain-containing protein [Mycena crocata]
MQRPFGILLPKEIFWYNHREWLKAKGYILRARYQEGWAATWTEKDLNQDYEDALSHSRGAVLDATRVSDGAFVMLKKIDKTLHPFEVEIGTWFSAEPQRSDPQNHCVPIYEVLEPPNSKWQIIVMPLLTRFDKPRFDTIGEAVSFFLQIFEGVKYMHNQNVAHRDCARLNIMMDASPLYTVPFHPVDPRMKRDYSGKTVPLSRTVHPVKYYLTDFGLSVKYKPEDRPPMQTPVFGADKTVPEFQTLIDNDLPPDCDPFPVDVYYIGNLMRENFLLVSPRGFDFLEPLVADMVNKDPALRPTMEESFDRLKDIVDGLNHWKLRSRVGKDRDAFPIFRSISHWIRRVQLVIGRHPPIPVP